MEKKAPIGLILLGLFLILLGLASFPEIILLKRLPDTISFFIDSSDLFLQHPFYRKTVLWNIVDILGSIAIVCVVPIACLFMFRLKKRAHRCVIYTSIFIIIIFVVQLIRAYYVDMELSSNMRAQELMREYVGVDPDLVLDNMIPIALTSLIRILLYVLPIFYLTRPKVKKLFE